MSYTVQKLANISGVSVRTLHYYDEIGLLSPSYVKRNGYRFYDEKELLRLQQIMFFKELDFPLSEIKKIIENPNFNEEKALKDHRKMIEVKKERMTSLLRTIDQTINKITKRKKMEDKELYEAFNRSEEKYGEEVKEKWGNTKAYKESKEKVSKMSKGDMIRIQKESDELMKEIVSSMKFTPENKEVQKLIGRHYNNLRNFYEPNLEMYKGLGEMYVSDKRFTAYFEKYATGLAVFMRDAIYEYCKENK
jgi:DNA-binding transcriptional MerR regulator